MIKFFAIWILTGVIVGYLKVRQSQQLGFTRKIELATIPHFIIGVILWPFILLYLFKERKLHKEAYLRSKLIRTELDDELDELEKELDKLDRENGK